MRITSKISSAGGVWMCRFPMMDTAPDEFAKNGRLDFGAVCHELGRLKPMVMMGSDDDEGVVAFVVEYLWQLYSVTKYLEASQKSDCRLAPQKSVDRTLERRMNREAVAYCRQTIDRHAGAIRVRMNYANPRSVVGTVEVSARKFAVYCGRILNYVAGELGKRGIRVELVGVGDAADVFAEAAWTDRRDKAKEELEALNERRDRCDHRCGDFCSPVKLECPCCSGGRCVVAELPPELKNYSPEVAK